MFYLLFLLSLSYWYHLPVFTQSVITYSEFRGYDILLVLITALLFRHYQDPILRFFKQDPPGRLLFRFTLWATVMSGVTIISCYYYAEDNVWSLVTLMFLFHLWGFVLAYAAFRLFVHTPGQCLALLDTFLIIGIAEGLVICLQAMDVLPLFWGERYQEYGSRAFSATLGPNRQLPGYMMILVFVVAAAYWRNWRSLNVWRVGLAAAGGVVSVLGVALSTSRTSWVTFIAFFLISFVGRRQFGFAAFAAAILVAALFLIPQSVRERIEQVYYWRVSGPIADTMNGIGAKDDELGRLDAVDAGRLDIWSGGFETIVYERPWLIPFGGGFNNYLYAVSRGASAHNMYMTLLGELGIVGLSLYVGWLISIIRESARLSRRAIEARAAGLKTFVPAETSSLVMAVMIGLLAGEILYAYRPSFTFMGSFLFLCAIMHHPALIYGTAKAGAAHDPREPERNRSSWHPLGAPAVVSPGALSPPALAQTSARG
jgi:O-antigen ligase